MNSIKKGIFGLQGRNMPKSMLIFLRNINQNLIIYISIATVYKTFASKDLILSDYDNL